jgi:hypothetical protein
MELQLSPQIINNNSLLIEEKRAPFFGILELLSKNKMEELGVNLFRHNKQAFWLSVFPKLPLFKNFQLPLPIFLAKNFHFLYFFIQN